MQGGRHSGRREGAAALEVRVERTESTVVASRVGRAVAGRHDSGTGGARRAEVPGCGGRGEVAAGGSTVDGRRLTAAGRDRPAVRVTGRALTAVEDGTALSLLLLVLVV